MSCPPMAEHWSIRQGMEEPRDRLTAHTALGQRRRCGAFSCLAVGSMAEESSSRWAEQGAEGAAVAWSLSNCPLPWRTPRASLDPEARRRPR